MQGGGGRIAAIAACGGMLTLGISVNLVNEDEKIFIN